MEEILHHLECINLVSNGLNYPSTGAGFLPSTVLRYRSHHKFSRTRNHPWGFECNRPSQKMTWKTPPKLDAHLILLTWGIKTARWNRLVGEEEVYFWHRHHYIMISGYTKLNSCSQELLPQKERSSFQHSTGFFSGFLLIVPGTLLLHQPHVVAIFEVRIFWTRRKDPVYGSMISKPIRTNRPKYLPLMLQSLLQLVLEWVLGA